MPTHGIGFGESAEALEHRARYEAGRARARRAEEREQRSAARAARAEERERKRTIRLHERERRRDQRLLISDLREEHRRREGEAEELRFQARETLRTLRADPLWRTYKTWAPRIANNTTYDADVWRATGRLQAIPAHNPYHRGGLSRRAAIDWTDVLDRVAQERGLGHVHDLQAKFERMERQERRAYELAADADEARRAVRRAREQDKDFVRTLRKESA